MIRQASSLIRSNSLRWGQTTTALNNNGSFGFIQDQSRNYSDLPVTFNAVGAPGRSAVSGIQATVFGSTGFLGGYLVDDLGEIGSRLVLPTRCSDMYRTHLRTMGDLGQINFMDFDVRTQSDLQKAVKGSNVVVNLIGREMETKNFTFEDVHVDAAKRIAEACAEAGVSKFVHVSALGAHEDAPSKYFRTKAAGEKAIKEIFPDVTIVRPAVIYGWEDRFFNRMAQASKGLPFLPIVDGGETKYQPVHVCDVSSAIMAIVKSNTKGQVYELAGPDVFTLKELYELMFETIRDYPNTLMVPSSIANMVVSQYEWIANKLPFPTPFPIAHGSFTSDAVKSLQADYVAEGNFPGFEELGIEPRKVDGLNIDYLRAYRAGGYDFGNVAPKTAASTQL